MAELALFRIRNRAVFSLSKGYDSLILFLFALFLILGQFLRLIPLPYFPSHFSLAEALLYFTAFPLYFCKLRKSMWLLLGIGLSTLYGTLIHGMDLTSVLYGFKLLAMIIAGVVVGDILFKKYSLEQCLDFLLRIFSIVLFFGAMIFFFFPKADLFFAFLDQYGIHFFGDPHQHRFISPFFDPNYYAAIACIPLMLTWIRKKHLLFFLFLASILLTFSRSGIATCLILLLLQMRKLPVLLVLGIFISCFYFHELMIFFERLIHFTEDESALARLDTFRTGAQFFWQHPFFGVGYHYLAPLFFWEFGRLAPDSSLLITLVDFGLIPTLLFALYGVYWSIRQFNKMQPPYRTPFFWLYIYLLLSIFFTSQFNNLLYYQYWLIPMIALFTFLNRSKRVFTNSSWKWKPGPSGPGSSNPHLGGVRSPFQIIPRPSGRGSLGRRILPFSPQFFGSNSLNGFIQLHFPPKTETKNSKIPVSKAISKHPLRMKTALVYDWLVAEGGGEKVLKALSELFPGPIYTLFQNDNFSMATHTSFLQKIPGIQKHYRNFLPLFPFAIESFDLSSYDLIVSSSHCVAKSVSVLPHQTHICYCHTPMRYAWEGHLTPMHPIKKILAKPILKALQLYDLKTTSRVDHFIANSTHVANRIRRFYGREATVIHPPVDTHLFSIAPERENYFFACARLVPNKRIELLLEAFAKLPKERLLIAGDGPQKEALKRKAPKNVTFLGYLPDATFRETLSKAKAFLHAAEEDFGIALVEAQSAGIPVIAYGVGGSRDIVIAEKTGLFFEEQTPESLLEALVQFEMLNFDPSAIKQHAEKFSRKEFFTKMRVFLENLPLKKEEISSCTLRESKDYK